MYYREIQYDESDYEDGSTPGEQVVTFDDLEEEEGDAPFDYEAYRKEVPPRKAY